MKNIILLAMSAINKKEKNDFSLDPANLFPELKHRTVKDCISQLEPVTRLLLENHPEADTNIVILATDLTRCAEKRMDPENAAADFFAERIRQTEKAGPFSEIALYDNGEAKIYEITGEKRTIRFFDVRIKEREPLFGIGRAVSIIRGTADREGLGEFWVAANGGLRDSYLSMNAIVSLLRNESMNPNYILSTEVNDKTKKIYDASPAFDMFMFVSGINEFNRFGSVDILIDYYASQGISKNDKVIDAMSRIALGNKLNAVFMYEQGIQKLAAQFRDNPPKMSRVMRRNEFQIFRNEIKADYRELLGETGYSYIDIVERCYRKKMYQQALTIIESKMYEQYMQEKLLTFSTKGSNIKKNLTDIKKKAGRLYDDDHHFVVDHFMYGLDWLNKKEASKPVFVRKTILEFLLYRKEFIEFAEKRKMGKVSGSNINNTFSANLTLSDVGITLKTPGLDATAADRFGYLLRAHLAVKEVRNKISHGEWDALQHVIADYNNLIKKGTSGKKSLSDHEGIEQVLITLLEIYIAMYRSLKVK